MQHEHNYKLGLLVKIQVEMPTTSHKKIFTQTNGEIVEVLENKVKIKFLQPMFVPSMDYYVEAWFDTYSMTITPLNKNSKYNPKIIQPVEIHETV